MGWKDGTPDRLQPAVKHIVDIFDGSDFKCSWITQHLCFADLHSGKAKDDKIEHYRAAFLQLRKIVGTSISNQFDLTISAGTPSAIFHAYAEMYRYGLNTAVRDMFVDALQIGISNASLLNEEPVAWAKSLVEERIRNGQHRFRTWIKNVCDVQPFDEDIDEVIYWRKWRALEFTHMRPSGNTPYNQSTAWNREDEQKTSGILDGLSKRFTDFVEIELGRLAGRAHVQTAKSGVASVPQAQSVQSIGNITIVNDREFARLAIEEARKSVAETDGRVHPMVGAVVVKEGKILSVAHRGEIVGNHAEFVALEKKLANVTVSGATVYTTLEPCTTRNHPKIPCAQRLIERKVARVVLGMLDPDERIRGKGQMRLRDANIATDFFPSDLMTEVEELNRHFIRDRLNSSPRLTETEDGSIPIIVPLRYGSFNEGVRSVGGHWHKADGTPFKVDENVIKRQVGKYGLFVKNDGEPAYDVAVSEPHIGTSVLKFETDKPRIAKEDGEEFFPSWIETSPRHLIMGSGLFEEMRKQNIPEIEVTLTYKDSRNRWYQTLSRIERDVMAHGGLTVRYVRQERAEAPKKK